ncbi:MAG: hypothetical protein ABIK86_05730 [candidate division WOR-3 bacterium]
MMRMLSALYWLLAFACSQVKTLTPGDALADAEKLEYVILASIAPEAGAAYLTAGTKAGRADYLSWFWNQSPFAADRSLYQERAVQAR